AIERESLVVTLVEQWAAWQETPARNRGLVPDTGISFGPCVSFYVGPRQKSRPLRWRLIKRLLGQSTRTTRSPRARASNRTPMSRSSSPTTNGPRRRRGRIGPNENHRRKLR